MNGLRRWCRGYTRIELTGAAPFGCLNRFTREKIPFWDVARCGELTLRCTVYTADIERTMQAAARELCAGQVLHAGGLRRSALWRRPALVAGIALAVAAALFLQNFVWAFEVQGNATIPTQRIIRELNALGIGFGTWSPPLDTQVVKNQMLNRIPELSWLAVNRSGGVLQVLVSERQTAEKTVDRVQPADVVAIRDGIVTEMSVLNGYAAVKPGQAVTRGQLLVSGCGDWEGSVHVTRALAEVYALTLHSDRIMTPAQYGKKCYTGERFTQVSLVLGRKRIKISGNSGISTATCDKMIRSRTLTLPGGICFPLTVETVICLPYTIEAATLPAKSAKKLLTDYYTDAVKAQMIAGKITAQSFVLKKEENGYLLDAQLSCEEMIAQAAPVTIYREDDAIGADNQCREN